MNITAAGAGSTTAGATKLTIMSLFSREKTIVTLRWHPRPYLPCHFNATFTTPAPTFVLLSMEAILFIMQRPSKYLNVESINYHRPIINSRLYLLLFITSLHGRASRAMKSQVCPQCSIG